jgi:hypothetical protein
VGYERRFSGVQRFFKLLVSPSEAMRDIAGAPDYGGVIGILALEFIVSAVVVWVIVQKINFVGLGSNGAKVWAVLTLVLGFAVILAGGVTVVIWLVKSWLVKSICNEGSGWDFKTAAAVTGYAYVPNLIVTVIGIFVLSYFLPSITLDVSNPQALTQAVAAYQDQVRLLRWWFTLPVTLIGLLWKSYLGGLGTHFGTKKQCSLRQGLIVFFLLGLVRVGISFFYQF